MKKIKALALFSGGLDSILAARLIMEQGVEVEAVQFVTPFFNAHLLDNPEPHREKMLRLYGVNVIVEDISRDYLQLLRQPSHGFGKNFNPCIDCKILMFGRAKAMLAERGASFLISGEVLGQRPMSQRRDTMNVIERDSATRSILLRPLSALLLKETLPELEGWVDRSRLLKFSGRGRSQQLELAAQFGITEYPAPAGGCTLADPILGKRIRTFYEKSHEKGGGHLKTSDIRLLLTGRQFLLSPAGWLALGRNEKENERLEELAGANDAILYMEDWPGPTAVLKDLDSLLPQGGERKRLLALAAGLVVRYAKKFPDTKEVGNVTCRLGENRSVLSVGPLCDGEFANLQQL